MRMNIKRGWSFLILLLVYLLAAGAGIGVYALLPLPFWLDLLIADVAATVVVFAFSLIFDNASVYDPYWSVQPMVIVTGLAVVQEVFSPPVILAMVAIYFWGVRLTANWAYTFRGLEHDFQDWRYTMLEESTGKFYFLVNFFGIHLFPTLVVYACMLPVVFLFEQAPPFGAWFGVFFALSILAALLELAADCTMHQFKHDGGKGFLRKGVWKYSRHPNYLGEILFWWGIALATVCVLPAYWWTLSGAVLNTLLFLFVSIPMADKHQSRKKGFALYKKNTRRLLPIYKRQSKK